MFEHRVDRELIAAIQCAVVAVHGQNDAYIDAATTRFRQFIQRAVVREIGVFDQDVALCAANGGNLRLVYVGIEISGLQYPNRVAAVIGVSPLPTM